jgi:periplasmic divalent cation tolerance protein
MNSPDQTSHIVVLTTLPDEEQARSLVRRLVEERVVACGTILGRVTSLYRWKGAVEEAAEVQVLLKTRRDLWERLEAAVEAAHPYDVPELLGLPVEAGLGAYLEWVSEETADQGGASV